MLVLRLQWCLRLVLTCGSNGTSRARSTSQTFLRFPKSNRSFRTSLQFLRSNQVRRPTNAYPKRVSLSLSALLQSGASILVTISTYVYYHQLCSPIPTPTSPVVVYVLKLPHAAKPNPTLPAGEMIFKGKDSKDSAQTAEDDGIPRQWIEFSAKQCHFADHFRRPSTGGNWYKFKVLAAAFPPFPPFFFLSFSFLFSLFFSRAHVA